MYFYLAGIAQNGAIILYRNGYTSSSYYYGIVRVYYNGWGNICDYYYSSTEANVICHQLGYTGASSYSRAGLVRLELCNNQALYYLSLAMALIRLLQRLITSTVAVTTTLLSFSVLSPLSLTVDVLTVTLMMLLCTAVSCNFYLSYHFLYRYH